jgi:hypothetical protein
MNLVSEREAWAESYGQGEAPELQAYLEYKKNRFSEGFRLTRALEKFFEYVIHLEEKCDPTNRQ